MQASRQQQAMWKRALPFLSPLVFFLLWQVIVDTGIVPRDLLASPTQIIKLFVVKLSQTDPDGALLSTHLWVSVQEALYGYILALIIFLSGIVPCVINSFVGVRLTNPTLIQMARTYGATKWQIFVQICIPSALPMVFSALQMALAACWTTLVAAELIAADTGLGFLITMGRRLAMPDMVLLGMLMVGLTGFVVAVIIDYVEKRLLAGIRR